MTETEKSYIAGIIDGEGSIMLMKFHNNQLPAPCVTITSSTLELLEWIKDTIKAGSIKGKKNYNPEKHKNSYTYELKYDKAIELLKEISSYLIIECKRKRADLIIHNYKENTSRNGRYTPEQLTNKERFYNEFIGIK